MTRIRAIASEAFHKLPDEEQQTMAVHAFCDGLKDRGVAALVATQARNSGARAVRIAAEAIAVNTKKIETKRRSKSSKKHCWGYLHQTPEGIVIVWRTLNRLWTQRIPDLRYTLSRRKLSACWERRAGTRVGGEGEVTEGILEAGVGEDRPRPLSLQMPIERSSATGVKARDTCLTCALIPHRLGIVLVKTLSALGVANLATYKQIARKWLHGVLTAM